MDNDNDKLLGVSQPHLLEAEMGRQFTGVIATMDCQFGSGRHPENFLTFMDVIRNLMREEPDRARMSASA